MSHERPGKSDEWYTPKYIFDALDCVFDMDVASPKDLSHVSVPAVKYLASNSLESTWYGFVWMNPPYGDKRTKEAWVAKFIAHGNGIALMPDRTSASWWQCLAKVSDAIMFTNGRVCFVDAYGQVGSQPANGTTLFAIGNEGVRALKTAQGNGLGILFKSI